MWSIRILSGPQAGLVQDLKLGKNIFGRGGQSLLKIQSLGISKEHCEIHIYKDKMIIVDLKSSNGTFVNGVKIQNSLIHVGDKISLFDIIMDIIPTPDIRPKRNAVALKSTPPPVPMTSGSPSQLPPVPQMNYQGNAALQMNSNLQMNTNPYLAEAPPAPAVAPLTLGEKIENFIETVVMPGIYKLGILFSFKQVLLGFVICFVFGVTLLSMIPLTTITKESNLQEASKRAKSVARALARSNEQALLAGQLDNLNVQDALKEEGIKEAFIIQQSDGSIVAPSEKVGRDTSNPFILQARKESRASASRIDATTIGASHPIGVYDPMTGEPTVKYHAVVIYDVSSLNIDEGRVISLFMQTLIIASIMGLLLYYLFARMIEFPLRSLNQQIDQALLEKSDRTEVLFDYPVFQKLVSNVNTLLNRAWTGGLATEKMNQPQQNRDLEYSNLVDIISHPALVVGNDQRVIACNSSFEQLAQMSKDQLVNQPLTGITDSALSQIIESLIVRCKQSPYEKHIDQIPFSQFECQISSQAFLNTLGEAEYFVMTLIPSEPS